MKTHYIFFLLPMLLLSCAKFVEVAPPMTQLSSTDVFSSDASANSAVAGTYSKMMSDYGFASGQQWSVSVLSGLSADELINYNPDASVNVFYKNALTATNTYITDFSWNGVYTYVYSANAILEGLKGSTAISDSTKKQLEGEARFLRAFLNFYQVNLFGAVPIVTSTNYQINALISRSPITEVYDSIISDLKIAQSQLAVDYSVSAGERIRPNKWAATAMLARVYLYLHDWNDAKNQASSIIKNTDLFVLAPVLNSVFLANSTEAIWQLMPVQPGYNTGEGATFISTGYPQYAVISPQLLNAFEPNDQRRIDWVDSIIVNSDTFYFPFKYKVNRSEILTEYSMVLRLAEQYLIRAEAEAQLNDLDDAATDLNTIRARAGLASTTASDQSGLLTAILHERQIELFTEWGHRWLDLKRTGQADNVLGPVKSPDWQSTDVLYPIPLSDISRNPNFTQNPGY